MNATIPRFAYIELRWGYDVHDNDISRDKREVLSEAKAGVRAK